MKFKKYYLLTPIVVTLVLILASSTLAIFTTPAKATGNKPSTALVFGSPTPTSTPP